MPEQLIPGAPTETGTYFAVIKLYTTDDPQRCVLHYQKHKDLYIAVGHAFSIDVQAGDVVGYVGEGEPLIKMGENKQQLREAIEDVLLKTGKHNQDECSELADAIIRDAPRESGAVWVKADTKPEHNVGVLVFIPSEDNHITSGMWDISNEWVLLDEYRTPEEEVTHWMPLPAFPEGFTHDEIPAEWVDILKGIAKEELGKKESPAAGREEDGAAFSSWILDEGFARTAAHDGKSWLWHDHRGKYGQCNYTPAELYQTFKQQKEK